MKREIEYCILFSSVAGNQNEVIRNAKEICSFRYDFEPLVDHFFRDSEKENKIFSISWEDLTNLLKGLKTEILNSLEKEEQRFITLSALFSKILLNFSKIKSSEHLYIGFVTSQ